MQVAANSPMTGFSKTPEPSKNSSGENSSANERINPYLQNPTMPHGDACNDDGTLKDASEMIWPDSSSQIAGLGFHEGNDDAVWDDWNLDKNGGQSHPSTSIVSPSH